MFILLLSSILQTVQGCNCRSNSGGMVLPCRVKKNTSMPLPDIHVFSRRGAGEFGERRDERTTAFSTNDTRMRKMPPTQIDTTTKPRTSLVVENMSSAFLSVA